MRLSIVVPVYNVEKWLLRCLESLYRQGMSEKEFEVVIVNDGTRDNSLAIANKFAAHHSNVKVICRENGGLSAARNTGLEHAGGNYVWFVDSDDFIEPYSIKPLLEYAETNMLDVMCFNLQRYFEDGRIWRYDNPELYQGNIMTGEEFVIKQRMPQAAWAALYRRDFLNVNGLIFYEGLLHEDMEFTPRAYFLSKRIAYKDIVVVNYFQRAGSIMKSTQHEARVCSLLLICDSLYDFSRSTVPETSSARDYFNRKIAFAFSQALSHWTRDMGIKLNDFKNKPYYPLAVPKGSGRKEYMKIKLANLSLPLYCKIKNIVR